ncbi:MAG: FG-GAP-like repeat-containing protein [Sandaracinaceae bacterium]
MCALISFFSCTVDPVASHEDSLVAGSSLNESTEYAPHYRGVVRVSQSPVGQGTGSCGGFLIAPDVVLTAAHCSIDPEGDDPGPIQSVTVAYNLSADTPISPRQYIPVIARTVHPSWTNSTPANRLDLQLLRLGHPVEENGSDRTFGRIGSFFEVENMKPLGLRYLGWGSSSGVLAGAFVTQDHACGAYPTELCTFANAPYLSVLQLGDSGGPLTLAEIDSDAETVTIGTISRSDSTIPGTGTHDYVGSVEFDRRRVPGPDSPFGPGRWTQLASCSPTAADGAGSDGFDEPENFRTWQVADVDGDSRDDIIVRDDGGVDTFFSQGAVGHFIDPPPPGANNTPGLSQAAGYSDESLYSTIQTGDFNGDGRADLFTRDRTQGVRIFLSNFLGGSGTWNELGLDSELFLEFGDDAGGDRPEVYETLTVADVNGDGLSDIIGPDPLLQRFLVFENQGSGLFERTNGPEWSNFALAYRRSFRHGNLELGYEDACANPGVATCVAEELLTRDACGVYVFQRTASNSWSTIAAPAVGSSGQCQLSGNWFQCMAPGSVFACWHELSDSLNYDQPHMYETIRLADVDGDGCDEIVARTTIRPIMNESGTKIVDWTEPGTGILVINRGCGQGFQASDGTGVHLHYSMDTIGGPSYSTFPGFEHSASYPSFRAADVDGDGRADLLARGSSGVITWISNGSGFDPVDPHHPFWGTYSPVLPGGGTWADERYFGTIVIADLDGDSGPGRQLLARNHCGGESWSF